MPKFARLAILPLLIWIAPLFAQDLASFEKRIQQIQSQWRTRLGRVRANSAVDLLITSIAGAPVLTAGAAATLIGRSYPQANAAIQRLASAGILSPGTSFTVSPTSTSSVATLLSTVHAGASV